MMLVLCLTARLATSARVALFRASLMELAPLSLVPAPLATIAKQLQPIRNLAPLELSLIS